MKLLFLTPTPTSLTYLTQKWRTLTRTWLTSCQRHTHCSAAYCLRTHHAQQKLPQASSAGKSLEDEYPVLLTAQNDGLINSFNPVQLSACSANVDMQYCVARRKVI